LPAGTRLFFILVVRNQEARRRKQGDRDAVLAWDQGVQFNPQRMKVLRSRVAAVSTEGYWIALRTEGYEFERIPCELVGAFVDAGEQQTGSEQGAKGRA
jgi:hypothetical protein